MKLRNKFMAGVLLALLSITNFDARAAETSPDVIFLSPEEFDLEAQKAEEVSQHQDEEQSSIEVEMYINDVLAPKVKNLIETSTPGVFVEENSQTRAVEYTYKFDSYSQTSNQKNDKKYKIAEVTYVNGSSASQNYSITMDSTKTTNWTVTGKVGGETELGNALIAKTKVTYGVDVSRSRVVSKGTTLSASQTVPAKKTQDAVVYIKGYYSGGSAIYKQYSPQGTLIGYVTYTGQTAWSPGNNAFTIVVTER